MSAALWLTWKWLKLSVALVCSAFVLLGISWRLFLGFTPAWLDLTVMGGAALSLGVLCLISWAGEKKPTERKHDL